MKLRMVSTAIRLRYMVRIKADFMAALSRLWMSPKRVQRACRNAHNPLHHSGAGARVVPSENPVVSTRHALRRGIALVASSGVAASAIAAAAQPAGDPPAPGAAPPAVPELRLRTENLSPGLPSPADGLRAFSSVEDYLAAGAPADQSLSGPEWRSVAGVCFTILLDGKVLARATAMQDRSGALVPDAAARGRLASDAARTLWADVKAKFPPAAAAPETPEARRVILSSLVLSIELAGEPTPLLINDFAETNVEVAPGLEGIGAVMATAEKGSEWMFPLQQLALGITPADALSSTVSRASGNAALGVVPARTLREERGAGLFKFPVLHVVRTVPGGTPALLYRGHEPIDVSRMKYGELVSSAERLAAHLRARVGTSKKPQLGVYSPITGSSTPAGDDELALSLTLAALFEHAAVANTDATSLVDRWRDLAARQNSMTPVARAAAVIAGERAVAVTHDPAVAAELRAKVGELAPGLASGFDPTTGFDKTIPPAARGLVACALVRAARLAGDRDGEAAQRAGASVERAFIDCAPGELVSQMPWLGWAAQDLADLKAQKDIPSAPALRTLRDRVWEHQLTAADAGADGLDLVGGVVFTKGPAALPSATSARPVAFLAGAVADPRLTTPQERPNQLARVIQALRFLRQLQADESSAWMYPDRAVAVGGVRAAPWDHKMATEASVYTLLAYSRAIAAINDQVMRPAPQTPGK